MKWTKNVVTIVLTLVLLPFQGAIPAHAENFFFNCGGGGTYTVDQPSGVLTKSNNCKGSVRIDESVKKIGPSAFYSSLDLTDVYIPDSVLEIGAGAFLNAYDLTSVRLPNNLITIEDDTFQMTALKAITIPNTVTTIGRDAFYRTRLTSVVIPDSVIEIKDNAFIWNDKLTSITLGKSLRIIGIQVFRGTNFSQIDLPDALEKIDYLLFEGNNSLSKIIYCGPLTGLPTSPTCPPDRKLIVEAAATKKAAEKAAAEKAAADKAAADKAAADKAFQERYAETKAAEAKAAADKIKAQEDAIQAEEDRIQAIQDAKQLTITCKKGSTTKKIRGESPKCPKGYVNSIGNLLTFKAFSECQLYKKDATLFGAGLIDSGKTLIIENPNNWEGAVIQSNKFNRVTWSDLDCAFDYMGASERVRDVYNYKAANGVRTIRWGKITLKFEEGFFGTVYTFRQS